MTKEATDEGQPVTGGDPFIGRGYVCCRGPLKNFTITVTGLITEGEDEGRYQLEAEDDGHRWTISPERLARIFGESSQRACGCYPLNATVEAPARPETASAPDVDADSTVAVAASAEMSEAETPAPAHEAPAEPTHSAAEGDQADSRGVGESDESAAAPPPAPQGVIFNEGSQQGALF